MSDKLAVVIMAAGKGTRMNDPSKAKVMFSVGDVPMVGHVADLAFQSGADRVIAVVGYNREAVRAFLEERYLGAVELAEQLQQLGTGHAVMQAAPLLSRFDGDVLVLSGDVPLLSLSTINNLIERHRERNAVATVLSVEAPDPAGYGRLIRGTEGMVEKIVEHRDASPEEREVREINSGIYLFRAPELLQALDNLDNDNAQNEYYLTDVFAWFHRNSLPVAAYRSPDFDEVQGVNTVEQLAEVDREYRARVQNYPTSQ